MEETNQKAINSLIFKNKEAPKAALFLFTHFRKSKLTRYRNKLIIVSYINSMNKITVTGIKI
jgi:hypothetical protein